MHSPVYFAFEWSIHRWMLDSFSRCSFFSTHTHILEIRVRWAIHSNYSLLNITEHILMRTYTLHTYVAHRQACCVQVRTLLEQRKSFYIVFFLSFVLFYRFHSLASPLALCATFLQPKEAKKNHFAHFTASPKIKWYFSPFKNVKWIKFRCEHRSKLEMTQLFDF